MDKVRVEMNFCRRCGTTLQKKGNMLYVCEKGHPIFLNASPTTGLVLVNEQNELLILERSVEPGKGLYDIPGGFCDGPESVEDALAREVEEEVGLGPADYTQPEYVINVIDPYDYSGETLFNSATIYKAKLISSKQPVAADDAASATWMSASEIDLEKVYFPAVRAGLEKVISQI